MRTGEEDEISAHFQRGKKSESRTEDGLGKMSLTANQMKAYLGNKYGNTTKFLHFITPEFWIFYSEDTYGIVVWK